MIINWAGVKVEVVPYYNDNKHKQVKLTFNRSDDYGQPIDETAEFLLPWKPAKDIGTWLIEMSQKARAGS